MFLIEVVKPTLRKTNIFTFEENKMTKDNFLNFTIGAWITTGFLYSMTDNLIFLGMCGMCFVVGLLTATLK